MNPAAAPWTVQQLARTVKDAVESSTGPVWVRGEVTGVKRYPSGHWYFGLRDELARVDCTMWRSAAARLRGPIEEGAEVFVLGSPQVWEERTQLRFNVTQLLPAGAIGSSAQAVEQIRQRLAADGLLDPARKRPLPPFPERIAVVTSIGGAVLHDVMTVARNRWPAVELVIIGTAVQGENAPSEIVRAIDTASRIDGIDCCIVGRGGGSREDLAAFNDEDVCRAIAACPVPVISAVGHEVDVTLADLVADVRAATPSQAAEFALPDRDEVTMRLASLQNAMTGRMTMLLARRRDRLERTSDRMTHALRARAAGSERRLARSAAALAPALERRLSRVRERLARSAGMLESGMMRCVARRRADAGRLAGQLEALSPLGVLARGYSMATDDGGTVLRRVADLPAGKRFRLTIQDGAVEARVEGA